MDLKLETERFLGRTYFDPKSFMWSFVDGSGPVPEEMRQELYEVIDSTVQNGIPVLGTLFAWKERLKNARPRHNVS